MLQDHFAKHITGEAKQIEALCNLFTPLKIKKKDYLLRQARYVGLKPISPRDFSAPTISTAMAMSRYSSLVLKTGGLPILIAL